MLNVDFPTKCMKYSCDNATNQNQHGDGDDDDDDDDPVRDRNLDPDDVDGDGDGDGDGNGAGNGDGDDARSVEDSRFPISYFLFSLESLPLFCTDFPSWIT